jgi:hypothetical protein
VVPLLHPFAVTPFVGKIPDVGGGAWRLLVKKTYRIGFVDVIPVMVRSDVELVQIPLAQAGDEAFPDPGVPARSQDVRAVPSIEAADHANLARRRRPHSEIDPRLATCFDAMGPQLVIDTVMASLVEQEQVLVTQQAKIVPDYAGTLGLT